MLNMLSCFTSIKIKAGVVRFVGGTRGGGSSSAGTDGCRGNTTEAPVPCQPCRFVVCGKFAAPNSLVVCMVASPLAGRRASLRRPVSSASSWCRVLGKMHTMTRACGVIPYSPHNLLEYLHKEHGEWNRKWDGPPTQASSKKVRISRMVSMMPTWKGQFFSQTPQ